MDKGESLRDTVATLSAYDPAAIVIRAPWAGAADIVARCCSASVVNAGDGKHEHPSQALLDVFTLRRRVGSLEGLRIWIVGDVLHSRVARSNVLAFTRMGAHVTVCGPPTLIPREVETLGCEVAYDLDRLGEADVVYALRMQNERMEDAFVPSLREYVACYQIDCPPAAAAPAADAPGPGEPRRRAGGRRDGLAAGADRRSGRERAGGADGDPLRPALRAGRRRRAGRRPEPTVEQPA